MIRQEAAFLEGALRTGDPTLERRLLIGHGAIRAIRAQADGARLTAGGASDLLKDVDTRDFVGASSHLECLRNLAASLHAGSGSRRDMHTALVEYGCRLALEDHTACALAALSLSERIWDDSCDELVAMKGFYRYALIMVRGERPLEESRSLPVLLSLRARRARSGLHRGFARLLHADVLTYRGNLPAARRCAKKVVDYGTRIGSRELVSNAHIRLAAVEGRATNFEQALAHGAAAFQTAGDMDVLRQNALNMMARALIDLGRLDDARLAFELASVSERSAVQTLVLLGLMDLALLSGDHARFERLRRRVGSLPMAPAHRTYFIRLWALGSAAAGNTAHARALLEEGQQLARSCGFSFEYLELDTELQNLSQREASARAAKPQPHRRGLVADVLQEIEASHRAASVTLQVVFA